MAEVPVSVKGAEGRAIRIMYSTRQAVWRSGGRQITRPACLLPFKSPVSFSIYDRSQLGMQEVVVGLFVDPQAKAIASEFFEFGWEVHAESGCVPWPFLLQDPAFAVFDRPKSDLIPGEGASGEEQNCVC
jgi:hypothetical protein